MGNPEEASNASRGEGMKSRFMFKPRDRVIVQIVSFLAIAGFSMVMRVLIPPSIILGTSYDDWLQVHLAGNILSGNWLGPWEIRTLIKGPGYPLFLAASNLMGISPVYAVHVLYLVACFFALQFLKRLWPTFFQSNYIQFFLYFLLCFNPVVFSSDFSRIYRNGLFAVLIFFGTVCGLDAILLAKKCLNHERMKYKFAGRIFLASFLLGYSIVTRLDGSLIFPIILFAIIFVAFIEKVNAYGVNRPKSGKLIKQRNAKEIAPILKIGAISIFLYFLPTFFIQTMNSSYYGINSVDDYSQGNFAAAMKTWQSIEPRLDDRFYIPVTEFQKEEAFRVSPKARMLEKYVKSEETWEKQTSCQQNVDCKTSGPWIVFEVRDAVVSLGLARDAQEFQKFFGDMNSELKSACAAKTISCGFEGLGTGIQPLSELKIKVIAARIYEQLADLAGYHFNYSYLMPALNPELNNSIGAEWRNVIKLDDAIWQKVSYSDVGPTLAQKMSTFYKSLAVLSLLAVFLLVIPFLSFRLSIEKYLAPLILISTTTLIMLQLLLVVGIATLSFLPTGYDKGYILSIQPLILLFQIMIIGFFLETIQDKLAIRRNRNAQN